MRLGLPDVFCGAAKKRELRSELWLAQFQSILGESSHLLTRFGLVIPFAYPFWASHPICPPSHLNGSSYTATESSQRADPRGPMGKSLRHMPCWTRCQSASLALAASQVSGVSFHGAQPGQATNQPAQPGQATRQPTSQTTHQVTFGTFGACCLDVRILTVCQLMGFALNH